MKVLTQSLKNGKTSILEVPSPSINSTKIRVKNKYSLISTGTESQIVNFGKASWINKARQQPARVKDVINKIRSTGITDTFKAIKNKLDLPMPMGYAAVGVISHKNENFNLDKGTRVFTNSYHQEEGLIDYNMCVEIPDLVDDKSASFGAIGGIAMQSIKCLPKNSNYIAIIGLGLLGQITFRILKALGYQCIVYDIDKEKIKIAEKFGAIGINERNITESILNFTKGKGVDGTIIAASSLSNEIINEAAFYTKRKGKIISSGLVGLNLVREMFFKKQIEVVVSNSSGNKKHKNKGSSYENISAFFKLLESKEIDVMDLISEEVSFKDPNDIYSNPKQSLFFSKLITYEHSDSVHTFLENSNTNQLTKLKIGLVGVGNFAMSTLIPNINKTKIAYVFSLLGREGLQLFIAKKRHNINKITTDKNDFYKTLDAVFISTSHETHFHYIKEIIQKSLPIWVEKPLVISLNQLREVYMEMLSNKSIYAIGYNRSHAPWTKRMQKKIRSQKADISMTINAGTLPYDHWMLNNQICGGRIIGEACHFVDLALTLFKHTSLVSIKCIKRDKYYQDTGNFILIFENGSKALINYRHDLPPSLPKEKIEIKLKNNSYTNNNWKKFNSKRLFEINFIKKGKGYEESLSNFFNRIRNNDFTKKIEVDAMCFSTYVSIKMQSLSEGESLNISQSFKKEILDKNLND